VTTVPVLIPPDSDDLGHVLAIIILASRWPAHLLLAIAEAHWSSPAGRAGVPGAHVKIASGPRLSCGPPARGLAPPPGLEKHAAPRPVPRGQQAGGGRRVARHRGGSWSWTPPTRSPPAGRPVYRSACTSGSGGGTRAANMTGLPALGKRHYESLRI